MEFARKIKDEEKQGRATMVLATPDDARLQEKFYDQVPIKASNTTSCIVQ